MSRQPFKILVATTLALSSAACTTTEESDGSYTYESESGDYLPPLQPPTEQAPTSFISVDEAVDSSARESTFSGNSATTATGRYNMQDIDSLLEEEMAAIERLDAENKTDAAALQQLYEQATRLKEKISNLETSVGDQQIIRDRLKLRAERIRTEVLQQMKQFPDFPVR